MAEWGFDRKTAGEFFGEFASCLVLIDTSPTQDNEGDLRELSDFVGLPFRVRKGNLNILRRMLATIALEHRAEIGS